jgi:hypothetical protein
MSTRSVIAVAKGDGWQGIYCHMEGYPTYQGPELWRVWHTAYLGDLTAFEQGVITGHPAGYSTFPDDCHCHNEWGDKDGEMLYTHNDEQASALFIEWVYVFSRRVLTIFTSEPTGEQQRCENDNGRWWMEPAYRWVVVCQVPLDGPEPDWQVIEDAASTTPPTPVATALAHRIV